MNVTSSQASDYLAKFHGTAKPAWAKRGTGKRSTAKRANLAKMLIAPQIAPDGSVTLSLPMRLKNPLNGSQAGWRAAARARKEQRGIVSAILGRVKMPELPLSIVLTRIGPVAMDFCGLVASLKSVEDGCADAIGVDDGDKRLRFNYHPEIGEYGVRIHIYHDGTP